MTPTDTAKKLFPVPAGPRDIIISFSFKAFIYSDCLPDLAITDFLGVLINCLKDLTFDSSSSEFFSQREVYPLFQYFLLKKLIYQKFHCITKY